MADGVHAGTGYIVRELPLFPSRSRCAIDLSDVTYYVGHETVVPGEDEKALPRWVEALFAFMQRNSAHLTEYFKLPVETVVEIGREVSI
jgi:KUP system potassium uptake protein